MAPQDSSAQQPRHHKPVLRAPQVIDEHYMTEYSDPAEIAEAAEKVALALIDHGRHQVEATEDVAQLVDLVTELGLETVAELWADAPPLSVGGALWRLYAMQTATRRFGDQWALWYRAGHEAHVARAIAGVVEPPTPDDLRTLTEQILTGVYSGDLSTALYRAAAYARIVSLGQAHYAERLDSQLDDPAPARALTSRSRRLLTTAEELEQVAEAWSNGKLSEK